MNIRTAIRSTPLIGPMLARLRAPDLVDSQAYWEDRYRSGGDSGAGSYTCLAEFKAEVLNAFVMERAVQTIVEFGCGDGAQLALANYPHYVGFDVSTTVLDNCRRKFAGRPYTFLHQSEAGSVRAGLALSLDVIFHLVEDDVFESYMRNLFDASTQWVIVYSSNEDRIEAEHVRHRKFTKWVERNRADFALVNVIPNRYPFNEADPEHSSFSDFYVYERC